MKCAKSSVLKKLMLMLLVLALGTSMVLAAAALETAPHTTVYLDGTGDGGVGTAEDPVNTLQSAYEVLLAVQNGIKDNAEATATIVVMGKTTQSTDFANTSADLEHKGTVTYTSNDGTTDYATTKDAKLILASAASAEMRVQLPGPTVLDAVTLTTTGSKGAVTLYSASWFKTTSNATVQCAMSGGERLFLRGGYAYRTNTDDVTIDLNAGSFTFVVPTNAQAASTGSFAVTLSGNTTVGTFIGGETATPVGTNASTSITVNSGATVTNLYVAGDKGVVSDAYVTVNGGTVGTLSSRREGKAGTAGNITVTLVGDSALPGNTVAAMGSANFTGTHTLVLSGRTATAETVDSVWDALTVTNSSDVTMAAALPEGIDLVVNKSSKLTLFSGDMTTHTGDGTETVVRTHSHNWVVDTSKTPVEGTCTTQGTAYYKCDVSGCTETKEVSSGYKHTLANGACSVCGGKLDVVYVKDGGTGDGFTAATAVGSLEDAYKALIANTDIENDASVKGTIVICGAIVSSENFNFENDGSVSHKGTVTLTSEYGGVDYRDSGAQLHLASAHTGTSSTHGTTCEQRFQVGGPTIMENLTINRAGSKQPLTIYAGTYLYIDETVQTLDTNFTYTPATPAVPALTDAEVSTIKLSAHRGYQPMGPENSILSFQAAADLGFAYIETDVYRTTDGELVCIHDGTLDRTTDGTGNVTQMTLAEVQAAKMDYARYGYDITTADPTKLYVPTFREYLEICKAGGCIPFIELKDTRNDVTEEIIDMAREYFDAEDIVISSGYGDLLVYAHQYNPDVFIHKIWGSEGEIATYAAMLNSKGEHYAGIAFDVQNLHLQENYEKAERLINLANDAGLQTCLRGADTITQVRYMYKLGIDYYPTNTTSPEKLQELKTEIPGTPADFVNNGQDTKGTDDHRIFVRGGYNSGTTTEDISITLMGGQYDMVAPSNGEKASTGDYEVTVGGKAYVSRLVMGETGGSVADDRDSAKLTVQDDAIVANLYLAGDKANVKDLTVDIDGGWIKAMSSSRGKNGTVTDLTVNVADVANMPDSVSLDSSIITGEKVLNVGGTGELGDCDMWDSATALEGAVITLTGKYPSGLTKENTGKFYVNDQGITFGTVSAIKEDGAAVELGTDIPYTATGSGQVSVTWYANGVARAAAPGAALSAAPKEAGTYWVGISMAEAATDNAALFHAAVPEQFVQFTIVHDLTEVGATAPDCTTDGIVKHYTCAGCDKIFADAEGKTELQSKVDPATGHDLDKVAAKAATVDAEGNIEHYACGECGKLFNDDKGTKELTKAEVTTPKLQNPTTDPSTEPTTKPTEAPTTAPTTKPTEKPTTTSPATGDDHSAILAVWLMLGALLAMAYTVKKREA